MSEANPAVSISAITTAVAQHFQRLELAGDLEGKLTESARRTGAEILSGVTVWGAFAPNEFAATAEGGALRLLRAAINAKQAPTARLAVPGWTLPGVMTTGAAHRRFGALRAACPDDACSSQATARSIFSSPPN